MDSAYFLSEMELAALCRCTRTNVVIFKRALATGTLEYCQHRISDPAAPVVYTSVEDSGGGGATRSHFERVTILGEPVARPAVDAHVDVAVSPCAQAAAAETGHCRQPQLLFPSAPFLLDHPFRPHLKFPR